MRLVVLFLLVSLANSVCAEENQLRATGDLGIIIERTSGSVQVIETTTNTSLGRIQGLGDLSHASAVYSRDARFAYVFGRDGGLTKLDLLTQKIAKRIIQSGNSIGGAISQDGSLIAVSNYKPGGVRIFDSATLDLVLDVPAEYGPNKLLSKVIGLVDAPDMKFVFSLWDAGEIWIVDMSDVSNPLIKKFMNIGKNPYDALITPDGRYYLAGLFGEDGLALLDLWNPDNGVQKILQGYGKGSKKLPVYKMPHLEGWAIAGRYAFVPAVGLHEVLVIDTIDWTLKSRIPVYGQPVFVVARPDGRYIWVNFAVPKNESVQIIDTQTLQVVHQLVPGKGVLHMEFEPRGEEVWLSVRDKNLVQIYNTRDFSINSSFPADTPSGIFLSARAQQTGL